MLLYPKEYGLDNDGLMFWLLERKERMLIEYVFKLEKGNENKLLNVRDKNGNDALLFICGVRGKTERIIKFLIESGADVCRVNHAKQTISDRYRTIHKSNLRKYDFQDIV